MMDDNRIRYPHSAQAHIEDRARIREREWQKQQEQIRAAVSANTQSMAPIVDELRALVKETQEQNAILKEQVDSAEKEAKSARVLAIVSLVISTLVSLASLAVALWERLG